MNPIHDIFSGPIVVALGWTLVHALWQSALLAIILATMLVLMRSFSSNTRYIIAISMLAMCLVTAATTFYNYYEPASVQREAEPIEVQASDDLEEGEKAAIDQPIKAESPMLVKEEPVSLAGWQSFFTDYIEQHLPLIVMVWLVGVVVA